MPVYFGDKIRTARKAARLTQQQLADKIKVSNTSISNWEKNISRPDPDTIQHLCWALDVEPNYFFAKDSQTENLHDIDDIVEIGDDGLAVVDDSPIIITGQAGQGKSKFIANQYMFLMEKKEVAEARRANMNIIRMAGRDGTYIERALTDDQMAAIQAMLNAMPDASEDL